MDKLKKQTSSQPGLTHSLAVAHNNIEPNNIELIKRHGNHYAGRHYIVDFWGMKKLTDRHYIDTALRDAAIAANATLLHIHLHEFSGGGITGVALLAESHISIHTWPEYDYAAFDVFMCGQSKPEKAVEILTQAFAPNEHDIKELLRGQINKPK